MHKMDLFSVPRKVSFVLNDPAAEKETQEIWLIGSRANENERPDSGGDFIVFVMRTYMKEMQEILT